MCAGLTKELNSITATVREVENAVLKVETTPSAYPNISAVIRPRFDVIARMRSRDVASL